MFKVKNNIALEIMEELFVPKMSPYDLRNNNSFRRRRVNSVWHGTESVSYLGPKIWNLVPSESVNLSMLSNSKSKYGFQNISWANRVYNNIKKWFAVK